VDESSRAKTIFFWVFIILLGIVLWKWSSDRGQPGRELKYSELLEQAERGNIREVTFYLSSSTAEVRGELRQTGEKFHATIPKESIPDLTKMLREKSVPIDVKQGEHGDWLTFLLNAAPLFLLVGFWIFMMRRMTARKQSGDKA
jgi:ATP-dependent Zn protease